MALSKEQQEQLDALLAEKDKPEQTTYECDVKVGDGPTTTVRGSVAERWLRQLGLVADEPAPKEDPEGDPEDDPDAPPASVKKFFK